MGAIIHFPLKPQIHNCTQSHWANKDFLLTCYKQEIQSHLFCVTALL